MADILELVVIYDKLPKRIRPKSLWFGAEDFSTKQQWFLRADDLDNEVTVDLELRLLTGFVPTIAAEETSKIKRPPPKKLKLIGADPDEPADPRQMHIDYVTDYEIGFLPPPKRPD